MQISRCNLIAFVPKESSTLSSHWPSRYTAYPDYDKYRTSSPGMIHVFFQYCDRVIDFNEVLVFVSLILIRKRMLRRGRVLLLMFTLS